MGVEDIVYDLIKEFRASKSDRKKQIDLAKAIAKKTYLRFYFEWDTEKGSKRKEGIYRSQQEILYHYCQVFLDIAVEIYDVLPEESERMKNIASLMKEGAYGLVTSTKNEVTPVGDNCALKVTEYVDDLIQ